MTLGRLGVFGCWLAPSRRIVFQAFLLEWVKSSELVVSSDELLKGVNIDDLE